MLEPGTKVRVFQKPLTDEEFEGFAFIDKCVDDDDEAPRYVVRFEGDPLRCQRVVLDRHAVE